jgi:hypothetical protein
MMILAVVEVNHFVTYKEVTHWKDYVDVAERKKSKAPVGAAHIN